MFVGNNVETDYEGAGNLAIHALLIDKTEKKQSKPKTNKNLKDTLTCSLPYLLPSLRKQQRNFVFFQKP
jgi:FMN phosphatase YigB (HAD superfamily)